MTVCSKCNAYIPDMGPAHNCQVVGRIEFSRVPGEPTHEIYPLSRQFADKSFVEAIEKLAVAINRLADRIEPHP